VSSETLRIQWRYCGLFVLAALVWWLVMTRSADGSVVTPEISRDGRVVSGVPGADSRAENNARELIASTETSSSAAIDPSLTISGVTVICILAGTDERVPGALVSVFSGDRADIGRPALKSGISDARGVVVLDGLVPGKAYRIAASASEKAAPGDFDSHIANSMGRFTVTVPFKVLFRAGAHFIGGNIASLAPQPLSGFSVVSVGPPLVVNDHQGRTSQAHEFALVADSLDAGVAVMSIKALTARGAFQCNLPIRKWSEYNGPTLFDLDVLAPSEPVALVRVDVQDMNGVSVDVGAVCLRPTDKMLFVEVPCGVVVPVEAHGDTRVSHAGDLVRWQFDARFRLELRPDVTLPSNVSIRLPVAMRLVDIVCKVEPAAEGPLWSLGVDTRVGVKGDAAVGTGGSSPLPHSRRWQGWLPVGEHVFTLRSGAGKRTTTGSVLLGDGRQSIALDFSKP
jgi:hypothetical protein